MDRADLAFTSRVAIECNVASSIDASDGKKKGGAARGDLHFSFVFLENNRSDQQSDKP